MCGRFASHVQIIEGSPVDIISMCLQIRLSFIITLLVFVLNSLMLFCVCDSLSNLEVIILLVLSFSSSNQQQAWMRLIVNALETNFFFYRSDLRRTFHSLSQF